MNGLYPIIRRVRRPLVQRASVTPAPVVGPLAKTEDEAKPQSDSPHDKSASIQGGPDASAPREDENTTLY